ncbi:hypothetical protein [Robbsia betulipollinis]|uniref:hypothetical protein n=1 Tax=Robbsia betulipollinis TaxID=2981849 RepID=UPI0032C3E01E
MSRKTGTILVAGGDVGSGGSASAERYDPGTRAWVGTGVMAAAQEEQRLVGLTSGQVLSIGTDAGIYSP